MKINDNITKTAWLRWLFFAAITIALPVLAGLAGWRYIEAIRREVRLQSLQLEAFNRLETLKLAVDSGPYVCQRLNDSFDAADSPADLQKSAENLNDELSLDLKFLVWKRAGQVFYASFDFQIDGASWAEAFGTFYNIAINGLEYPTVAETANIRRIFGPQFIPINFTQCYRGKSIRLLYGDSTGDGRLSWVKVDSEKGLAVFFSRQALDSLPGLNKTMLQMSSESAARFATIISGRLNPGPQLNLTPAETKAILDSSDSVFKAGNWLVFRTFLKTGVEGLCLIPQQHLDDSEISTTGILCLIALLVLVLLLIYRSFRIFFYNEKSRLSIRKQLIILFALANGLSLSILGILGFDYLREYRQLLQSKIFGSGMTYLQSIDEMFVSELTAQQQRLESALQRLAEKLKHSPPTREMLTEFCAAQNPFPFRVILVGSHTPYVGSEFGIMKDGEFIDLFSDRADRLKHMKVLVEAMGKLGRYYLALLNRESLSDLIITQVELIAESLGQLRSIEMFQEFFAATGSFWQWGMGWRYHPAFIQVFYLFESRKADYVFLYLWDPKSLEEQYIRKMFNDLNRNQMGLKIMAVHEDFRYSYPPELLEQVVFADTSVREKHSHLLAYTARLREKAGTEVEFCDWQGEKHLLMGLKCTSVASIRLLGLYPVSSIEKKVREKFWLFFFLGLVSLLISLALSLAVSRSILRPLGELQNGMLALQKHDFSYRLPDLGRDEFGHLAQIFNTTLVDLEELHTASIVHEKLVDSMDSVYEQGNFRIFGGCRALTSFGGDFFTLVPVDEQRVGVFVGDVAGTGVASTLVMAFVKASIIQLADLYTAPESLLLRIDHLLRSCSRGKQRQFMSLQYVLIDSASGLVQAASAGMCFPMLLTPEKNCRQIELPSIPLGAGSRPGIATAEIALPSGSGLLLYTAGLYRNAELGMARLSDVFCSVAHLPPDEFYLAVDQELADFRGDTPCLDDQTLVVVKTTVNQPDSDAKREVAC